MPDLATALGARPPAEFDMLSGADQAALAALVDKAANDRDQLINRAVDDSLRHIPPLLRGTVKRALGI
jgi:hypothetical protein